MIQAYAIPGIPKFESNVIKTFGVTLESIQSKSRKGNIAMAKKLLSWKKVKEAYENPLYLNKLVTITELLRPVTARYKIDRSTLLCHFKSVNELLEVDKKFRKQLNELFR